VAALEGSLIRKLAAALDAPGGAHSGEHLLVAVSGGPDSCALLAGLAELAPARQLKLTAAHVDHALRRESAAEGEQVAMLAVRLGVGCLRRTVRIEPAGNLEARARRARYRALGEMATEAGAGRIVTGHTQDDQVETMLLRLLRGAGTGGLGAMRPTRGRLFRPLLAVSRADVRRFLADRGLEFALDPTNADLRHARNRVRRLLVPLLEAEFNPSLGPALAALAARLRDEEDFLAGAAAALGPRSVAGERLKVGVAAEPPALGRRIVRAWLGRRATAAHVERVLSLAAGTRRGVVAVPGPARILREGEWIVRRAGREPVARRFQLPIAPGMEAVHPEGAWRLSLSLPRPRRPEEVRAPDTAHALFDADALPPDLTVRSPAIGDRLRLASGGTRKLQDVLVDAKVPREARPSVPVLARGEDILWVGGLARGRTAMIVPATTRIVEGTLERAR
jgi:tRNA(Ile)-lysidine synthase